MKIFKSPLRNFFLLLCVAATFQAASGQRAQKTARAVIKTHFNCNHCKKCETCGLKFESEMYNSKGIRSFEIDEKKMTITVLYNPAKISIDSIRNLISAIGYDADEVKANPIAYESLDECCKK